MDTNPSFGHWLKQQRRACDLTQTELAQRVYCAEITIRKIEADQLHPSKHLARVLLETLQAPRGERVELMQLARRNHRAKVTQWE